MSETKNKTVSTYGEIMRRISELLGVELGESDHYYYSFCSNDPTKGFLELIFPMTDSSDRLLRGASGNGPIFILLYSRGTWTFLGEMHGATAVPVLTNETTEFTTYTHLSARTGVVRRYQFRDSEYACSSEEAIAIDSDSSV